MFTSTIQLFDDYYRYADASQSVGFNRDLACEVREKLEQIDYIVSKVRNLEQNILAVHSRLEEVLRTHIENLKARGQSFEANPIPAEAIITREEEETILRAEFEMKLLTEAFYYFAGRVRSILRHSSAPLPGLASFECEGVRNTRNKLLEHPEGKGSHVFIRSFAWGGAQGPVIKALRYDPQQHVFPDRGLYENAREFRENLERCIRTALGIA